MSVSFVVSNIGIFVFAYLNILRTGKFQFKFKFRAYLRKCIDYAEPGAEEIEALCQLCFNTIKANAYEPLVLLPLYSILAPYRQKIVFESFEARKCVITTNITKTSLTVRGIKFVIDCGFVKMKQFIPKLGLEVPTTTPISKQSAIQRAARLGHGHYLRIYDEKVYRNMETTLMPETLRSNLSSVVLKVLGLGIESFSDFDLINDIESTWTRNRKL